MQNFNFCIIGSGGVGKTTFLKRIIGDGFERKYIPSFGENVYAFDFEKSTEESVILTVLDTPGQDFEGYKNINYSELDGVILMYDSTSKISRKSLKVMSEYLTLTYPRMPQVIVGAKIENETYRKVVRTFHNLPHCTISSKLQKGLLTPFEILIELQ